jgi:hypothetical protein
MFGILSVLKTTYLSFSYVVLNKSQLLSIIPRRLRRLGFLFGLYPGRAHLERGETSINKGIVRPQRLLGEQVRKRVVN